MMNKRTAFKNRSADQHAKYFDSIMRNILKYIFMFDVLGYEHFYFFVATNQYNNVQNIILGGALPKRVCQDTGNCNFGACNPSPCVGNNLSQL